ncbi:hypothetical protein, partial [Escherichia albertii]|uniref:hypothetical protein n=1 Tax=Escherichia albertii TaxID=208962 RepID=UPI00237AB40B
RRTGSTRLPDAPAYRAYRQGKPRLFALADICRPDKAFTPHPARNKAHRVNTFARCASLSGLQTGKAAIICVGRHL